MYIAVGNADGEQVIELPKPGGEARFAVGTRDAHGLPWKAQAIRGILLPAARALADEEYSDQRADAVLQKKILELEAVNAELARELDALRIRLKRSKLTNVIAGVAAAVGFVADAGGAGETIRGIIEWTTAQFDAGSVPDFSNLPPELLPDERRPDFGAGR